MPDTIPNTTVRRNPNYSYWLGKVRPIETRLKISLTKKGKPSNRKGAILSEATKHKLRLANLGVKQSPDVVYRKIATRMARGYRHSEQARAKMRAKAILRRGSIKKQDTSIEILMEAELRERSIHFQKQVPLLKVARVDFYIPSQKTVIQCDGFYWHNLPNVLARDKFQDEVLSRSGYRVFRFWDYEIKGSVEQCVNKVFANV